MNLLCRRFLRARKFNLVQSKRMITQCLQWRHQVEGIGIDELYRGMDPFDFPEKEHVFKYWPMYYHRTDKLGRPISIQRFGSLDLNKLYTVVDKETHFRSIIVNCEALTREVLPACTYKKFLNQYQASNLNQSSSSNSIELPKEFPTDFVKVTNAFCIVDLKGFTLSQFWQIKSIARICFGISQDYYPETMGYLAIINAPYTFATIFKAIQPWLSKDTISKINILGDNYVSTLLEHIEAEDLPTYLGGKCECDPKDLGNCDLNDPNFEKSPWLNLEISNVKVG
ncbi:CRAL-TRIO domain-containing protein [Melampsora americana]|nr:CRAL-TRIO domain-containing protein [Melampsora americana]